MKILFAPFYSMRSYSTGKWLLSRDGHATQCRNIIQALKDREDLEFHIIIPENSDDAINFFCLYNAKEFKCKIRLIINPYYMFNAASERLNFNYIFWNNLFERQKYDLIVYNNIENVRNIRVIADQCIGKHVKIISAVTHTINIDSKDSNYFLHRIIDGVYASNIVWYNTSDTYNILCDNLVHTQFEKLKHCYAYASSNEFDESQVIRSDKIKKIKNSFLFLSRLTDTNRTNADLFVELVKRTNTNFWITNPSDAEFSQDIKDLISNEKITCIPQYNRFHYIDTLKAIETVIILYDTEKSFSTSYHEALLAGCNVITLCHKQHFTLLNSLLSLGSLNIDEIAFKMDLSKNYVINKSEEIKAYFDVKTQAKYLMHFI